tara:strand:+ start:56 stop:1729 length:1674 start_codon:yes stop_codon:yes gene_type:complete
MPEPDLDRGGKPLLSGGIWDKKATDLVSFYLGEAGDWLGDTVKPGGWLGDAVWEGTYPIRAAGDTALALGTGMINMTASAAAALPTMFTSDDAFTREGSKEWRDKLMGTSEALDPYTWDAKTDFGKDVTGAIGGAFEFWNEEVAFPIGKGAGKLARNIFGMDQKDSEKLEASVVGVLTGAPGALGAVRIRGKETPLKTSGHSKEAIANARLEEIANIQSGRFLPDQWKLIDPDGYAKAVADGTAPRKIAEMIKDISIVIDETPVTVRKPKEGETVLGLFSRTADFEAKPPIKKAEITLIPEIMDRALARTKERSGSEGGYNEVARHEFIHDRDWQLYDKIVPSVNNPYGWPVPDALKPTNVNPATGKPWGTKDFWGNAAEGMPAINTLSSMLEDAVQRTGVEGARRAEFTRRSLDAKASPDWNAQQATGSRLGQGLSEWYPKEYGSKANWMDAIRKSESTFTSAIEVLPRVNNLQKALLTNKMDFFDIINMEKGSRIFNTKAMDRMPLDVQQLADYMQRSVDQGVVSKPVAIGYLVQALTEARMYFPKKYSVGLIGK